MAGMDDLRPTDRARRSFLYRTLETAGANFIEINGAAVAAGFGSAESEFEAAQGLGIADLSPLPRIGCKGPRALDWVRGQGVTIGDDNNVVDMQPGGALAARLADTEVLILDSLAGAGALPHRVEASWSPRGAPGAWLVNRQGGNFQFMVTGAHGPAMFAKLCAVDLTPAKFPAGAVAQTPVARVNCVVIRSDLGDTAACHVLGDSASAAYLWGCLADAMAEFDGRPVGIDALRRLDRGTATA